jgi:hypothetical protein
MIATIPDGAAHGPGPGHEVSWLRPWQVPDHLSPAAELFVRAVYRAAGQHIPDWSLGTVFGARSFEPTTPGEWHADSGEGVRFVTAVGVPNANQEFRDAEPLEPGTIAVYTRDVHRRPATGPGPRLFLSATLYRPGEDVDLTCHQLAPLMF